MGSPRGLEKHPLRAAARAARRAPLRVASLLALAAFAAPGAGHAQQVVTSTPRNAASGERVVRVETLLRQPPAEVWRAFATEPGLKCWAAPVVRLDLRTGGLLETNYDPAAAIGSAGTISLPILNVVEGEVLTLQVRLNEAFFASLRAEDGRLQEVIQLQPLPDGGTRVVSSMVGWGRGAEWDEAIEFFAKGNAWSYRKLAQCLAAR